MSALTFDRVAVAGVDHSAREFLALPLKLRVQHMLAGELEFFLGDVRVDQRTAVESLRRAQAR